VDQAIGCCSFSSGGIGSQHPFPVTLIALVGPCGRMDKR
jgi:hypothetical protein